MDEQQAPSTEQQQAPAQAEQPISDEARQARDAAELLGFDKETADAMVAGRVKEREAREIPTPKQETPADDAATKLQNYIAQARAAGWEVTDDGKPVYIPPTPEEQWQQQPADPLAAFRPLADKINAGEPVTPEDLYAVAVATNAPAHAATADMVISTRLDALKTSDAEGYKIFGPTLEKTLQGFDPQTRLLIANHPRGIQYGMNVAIAENRPAWEKHIIARHEKSKGKVVGHWFERVASGTAGDEVSHQALSSEAMAWARSQGFTPDEIAAADKLAQERRDRGGR